MHACMVNSGAFHYTNELRPIIKLEVFSEDIPRATLWYILQNKGP